MPPDPPFVPSTMPEALDAAADTDTAIDSRTSTDSATAPAPSRPGSRLEVALLFGQALLDVLSVPWHLVVFLFTRQRHRQRLLDALQESRR